MRILMALILCLCADAALAQADSHVTGTVFDDRNGDGRHGEGEPGIAGVAVSNGRAVARSDTQGRYVLASPAGDTVFVVKPAGWNVPKRAGSGLPGYWQQQPLRSASGLRQSGVDAGAAVSRMDFALHRAPAESGDLNVLVFADPQPKSEIDIGYYKRDIVDPLRGKTNATLGMSLGDIVDDVLQLYPQVNAVTASLGVPWLHAPGNHDMDLDAVDDANALLTWRRVFGPDTFAWEEPQANFVILDDVIAQPGQKPGYVAGFREDQLQWLRDYLAGVDQSKLLVVGMHMPMFETAGKQTLRREDRKRLFALLQPFKRVLLLSAHNHTQQHVWHGTDTDWHGSAPLHEYNVGAACGAFWSGIKDAGGIPDTTMADGTPNGHASLRVHADGSYALAWHVARAPQESRMRLHAPKVLRRGAYPAWGVYANVFMGDDASRVEFRVDGGPWQPMRKVVQADPWLLAQNVRDDEASALRGYDRSPEALPSAHLWRGALPTDLAIGSHQVDVRASDRWLGDAADTIRYRLQEAVSQ